MRGRLAVVLFSLMFTGSLFAKEVFLPVSGTANNVFFSDARIFNPTDHEITIQAYYLPRGNNSNAGEQPISFTVPSRQMKISDDIVKNLLLRADVGGIRFVSADDFVVTQRVYALTNSNCGTSPLNPCTLGQFVQGLDLTAAVRKGVILQLKAGEKFRTNVGALNPNAVSATVTWRLYDKNNGLVSTGTPVVMPPYATIGPTSITSTFFFNPGTADLTDAWVGFDSDQPIFAYGSVVDNGSSDQTYVPASGDSGTTAPPPPPPPAKTVTISAVNWQFGVSGTIGLKEGDEVEFVIRAADGIHGFRLFSPGGAVLIDIPQVDGNTEERTIVLSSPGTYQYLCTRTLCGAGHNDMFGEFIVGEASDPRDDY